MNWNQGLSQIFLKTIIFINLFLLKFILCTENQIQNGSHQIETFGIRESVNIYKKSPKLSLLQPKNEKKIMNEVISSESKDENNEKLMGCYNLAEPYRQRCILQESKRDELSLISNCGKMRESYNEISIFESKQFPAFVNESDECDYIVHPKRNTCAMRIDVIDIMMTNSVKYPTTRKCILDNFFILGLPNGPTESLCDLKNYSGIFLINEKTRPVKFLFVFQNPAWRVKVKVTQIDCSKLKAWENEPDCGIQKHTIPDDSKSSEENIVTFVVNGENAQGFEFPWQVSIQSPKDLHRCGASIINQNFLLTAAHCFSGFPSIDKLFIRLGDSNSSLQGNETYEIERIVQHYEYRTFRSHMNDIAVIKLSTKINYSNNAQPVCLSNDKNEIVGEGIVSGWGSTNGSALANASDVRPTFLQKLKVNFIKNSECDLRFDKELNGNNMTSGGTKAIKIEKVHKSQLCAVSAQDNSTVCFGDSGGPLVQEQNGKFYQVGIVSYGLGRCIVDRKLPVVYSRLSHYLKFIQMVISTS